MRGWHWHSFWALALAGVALAQKPLAIEREASLVMVGNGLGAQLSEDGGFEVLLHQRFPSHRLRVRNLCVEGDTAAYRPRAGRDSQWAFPGAETLRPEFQSHRGKGIEPSPDQWLTLCKADLVLGFFGYNESFDGDAGVEAFAAELDAWITHSQAQRYNGRTAPEIVLVSPIAYEGRAGAGGLPDGVAENHRLQRYAQVMREVAQRRGLRFVDLWTPTMDAQRSGKGPLTLNGFLPNAAGNRLIARELVDGIFGPGKASAKADAEALRRLVVDKNWLWRFDYRIPNGVHVYGGRRAPFGTVSYPPEIEKTRELVANRERAIWAMLEQTPYDLPKADAATRPLPEIPTNFKHTITFRQREEAIASFQMMEGFKIELFASEREFPDLRNPVQMSFDARGRLWVATVPSYPAYRPGDARPNDKLIVFEDLDGDGRADRQSVFADGLHMPMGFELAPEGVYVAQAPDFILLQDRDGDGRADHREVVLRGFDPHDTHHAIGAFCADPIGGIYMPEGIFLHSQVETAHGPRRDTYSGMWRFDPRGRRLERYSQAIYANPWGVAFDRWGQCFLADASNGNNWWELPLSVKVPFGARVPQTRPFIPKRARPTSGSEFISSRHFPDELQGAYLHNNVIGFLGTSIHSVGEDGSGFSGKHLGDLLSSDDPNVRLCDLEFAPDGSLYLIDWHNPLVGHMQHSARDPNRDHDHGRIYRVTYPSRSLVKPVRIDGAPLESLVAALAEPEDRTRYRVRRELRGRPADSVLPALKSWLASQDPKDPGHAHRMTEAMWVAAGAGHVDRGLLWSCLESPSHPARAAAVDVVRFRWQELPDYLPMLMKAAADEHPRVRLAAMVAASWIPPADGARVAAVAVEHPVDPHMAKAYSTVLNGLKPELQRLADQRLLTPASSPNAVAFLAGKLALGPARTTKPRELPKLPKADLALYELGKEVYRRESHCATCHQANGKGDKIYPPLVGSPWVTGDEERLIKLVLKGLWGPITVNGTTYDPKNGVPPMMPFEHLLDDQELAGVLTYIRNHFGNSAPAVRPEKVRQVREAVKDRQGFYMVEDLLKEHPLR